mmetsp:Transcript_30327/g.47513  ORF Transcript_30327/g.47513 Transcript_30327/m.47513 type:complete len:113 (-) Transcript_30327:690-1028(-)
MWQIMTLNNTSTAYSVTPVLQTNDLTLLNIFVSFQKLKSDNACPSYFSFYDIHRQEETPSQLLPYQNRYQKIQRTIPHLQDLFSICELLQLFPKNGQEDKVDEWFVIILLLH